VKNKNKNKMFNFLKLNNSVDEKEIIELKKKIAYMETDVSILKNQYDRLLSRAKVEALTDARAKKKEDDVDLQKMLSKISADPNITIQKIIAENPGIIRKIIAKI